MIRTYTHQIFLTVILLLCHSVFAAPTLDQYQNNEIGGVSFHNTIKVTQTFTAGLSGLLDHIEIGGNSTTPTTWEIQTVTAGVPSGTVLGNVPVGHNYYRYGYHYYSRDGRRRRKASRTATKPLLPMQIREDKAADSD